METKSKGKNVAKQGTPSHREQRLVRKSLTDYMLRLATRLRQGAWTGEDAAEYILAGSGITRDEAHSMGYTDLDDILPNT